MGRTKIEAPERIATKVAAVEFVNQQGYMVSRATFTTHVSRGYVKRDDQGGFPIAGLLEYAKAYLKTRFAGTDPDVINYQQLRIKADAENKRIMAARGELKLKLEQGKLIEKAKHEEDLAARMAFFKRELETFMLRRSGRVVELAQKAEPVLAILSWWNEEVAAWLDTWSQGRSFTVELDVMAVDEGVLGKGRGRARGMTGPKVSAPKGGK